MAASSSVTSICRPEEIKGRHILGRLTYFNKEPVINTKVKLYVKNWITKSFYGKAVTLSDGQFRIKCPKMGLSTSIKHTFIFKVIEKNPFFVKGGDIVREYPIYETELAFDISKKITDIGEIVAHIFDYEDDLPNLKLQKGSLPPRELWPYSRSLLKESADEKIKEVVLTHIPFMTISCAEQAFGVGDPTLELKPEFTIDMLLNGIYPCHFKKGGNENELYVEIIWDQYEKDASPVLPNARLNIDRNEGQLQVSSVSIQFPGEPWEESQPGDERFQHFLYLFNSAAILKGEIVSHLGTHMRIGEVAMAVCRTLKKNPVGRLLLPHLKSNLGINALGASQIFGEDGILNISGLTVRGIRDAIKDDLACFCYSGFKPRKQVNDAHVFALGGHLYWDIVTEYVDKFFTNNIAEIENHWIEIYYLSKNLVENSLTYRPEDGEYNPAVWDDPSEIDDPSGLGRVIIAGNIKAIRPVTLSKEKPEEADIEKLKQLCRYTIYKSTWEHWVVHSSQKRWLTNLKFATLAPEGRGTGEYGSSKFENAVRQMSTATILTDFQPEEGTLVNNYYRDICPEFIGMILEKAPEFQKLGYDVMKMFYGIII